MLIKKLYYWYCFGGLNYVYLKIKDKIMHDRKAKDKLYEILSHVDTTEYRKMIELIYAAKTGHKFKLDKPRTFNEKIQWLKLYDATELKTQLADKYLVREWIKSKIGKEYLIPLIGVWDSVEEIDIEKLPTKFCIKATHGCGWNIIVKNKNDIEWETVKEKLNYWLTLNYAFVNGLELQYLNIPHKIMVEEYIENDKGKLFDYKIHCFSGEPTYIQVIGDRDLNRHTAREVFYDTNWKKQIFTDGVFHEKMEMEKPVVLESMLRLAKVLSKEFAYARVDLYVLNENKIKFGEMTFTPASGFAKWNPTSANERLGKLIKLPKCNV